VWHLRVDKGLNVDGLTPAELVHMARNRREDPAGTTVLADEGMTIDGIDAWWLLLHQPDQDSQSIIGWLAVPIPGEQYIMASILTSNDVWHAKKQELAGMLSSIKALDTVALVKKRIQGHDAAIAKLASINESTLRSFLGFTEWRLITTTQPGSRTAVDIGYASISIEEGYAHEIDKDLKNNATEAEGIVITVKSRVIPNQETGLIVDTRAQYWISWDGKEDRWWNRVTRRLESSRAKLEYVAGQASDLPTRHFLLFMKTSWQAQSNHYLKFLLLNRGCHGRWSGSWVHYSLKMNLDHTMSGVHSTTLEK
jgi:hypothetical protein